MQRAKLRNSFFGPDGQLYTPGVHEFPDDMKLPKTAKVEGKKAAPKPAAPFGKKE